MLVSFFSLFAAVKPQQLEKQWSTYLVCTQWKQLGEEIPFTCKCIKKIHPQLQIRGGIHIIFFLFLNEDICCGYSLEAPHWGASNEYPQHMFLLRNKKAISIFRMKKAPYLLLWITATSGAINSNMRKCTIWHVCPAVSDQRMHPHSLISPHWALCG